MPPLEIMELSRKIGQTGCRPAENTTKKKEKRADCLVDLNSKRRGRGKASCIVCEEEEEEKGILLLGPMTKP